MNMSSVRLSYLEDQEKKLAKVGKEIFGCLTIGSKKETYISGLLLKGYDIGERELGIAKIINCLAGKEFQSIDAQLVNKGKSKEQQRLEAEKRKNRSKEEIKVEKQKKLELKEEHIKEFKMKVIELLLKDMGETELEDIKNLITESGNDDSKERIEQPVETNSEGTKERIEQPVVVKTSNDGTIREKLNIIDYHLHSAYKNMKALDINLPSKEKFKKLVKECKFYMRDIKNWRFNINNKDWECTPVVVARKEDYYKGLKNTNLYKNMEVQNLVKKLDSKEIIDAFEKVGCFLYEGIDDLSTQIIISNMKTNEAYVEMTKKYNKGYSSREELLIDILKEIE